LNPDEKHELTMTDYYALALAPAFYAGMMEALMRQGHFALDLSGVAMQRTRDALFHEARALATMSLLSRQGGPAAPIHTREERDEDRLEF